MVNDYIRLSLHVDGKKIYAVDLLRVTANWIITWTSNADWHGRCRFTVESL